MAQTIKQYYFELPGEDAKGPRPKTLGMTNDYRSRGGQEPVPVFSSPSELVVALAEHRRDYGYFSESEYRQTAIADAMGVQPAAVSRLECEATGTPPREATFPKLQAYARAMGYEVWLVCVERNPPFPPYSGDA